MSKQQKSKKQRQNLSVTDSNFRITFENAIKDRRMTTFLDLPEQKKAPPTFYLIPMFLPLTYV
jgi:hypothetical protein